MGWNKDGSTIRATYMDTYEVTGKVVESRVIYGGKVQYTVILEKPVQFRWRSEPSTLVLIDSDKIVEELA